MSISMNMAVSVVNNERANYAHWQKEGGNWDADSQKGVGEWYDQTLALLGADVPDIVGLNSQEVYRIVHFLHERDWHLGTGPMEPQYPIDAYLADALVRYIR